MIEMVYNERGESLVCSSERLVDVDRRGWMAVARPRRYRMVSDRGMSSGRSRIVDGLYMMCIERKRGSLRSGMDVEVDVWLGRR